MRFVEGVWNKLEGSTVVSARQAARVEIVPDDTGRGTGGDCLRILCSIREIKNRGDVLNKPTITIWIRSPAPGIFEVEAKHFLGKQAHHEPRLDLFPAGLDKAGVSGSANGVKVNGASPRAKGLKHDNYAFLVSAGGMAQARVDTRPGAFCIDFLDDKERIISSMGPDSISWALKTNVAGSHAAREFATTTTLDPYHRPESRRQGYMIMSPSLAQGEKVYGLGEQFGPFVKNGQTVEISNEDGGTSSAMAYKNIPFYMTSRGYGVYIDQTQHLSLEVQTEHRSRVQASVPGETMRMYFLMGPTPKDILTRYTSLTGRPPLPPTWSWGLWLSTSFLTDYDEETSQHFLDGMRKHDIQVSVFHFDCYWMRPFEWCSFRFNPEFFPDPKAFLGRINSQGIKVSVWINPYIAQEAEIFAEADQKGYLLHRKDGSTYQSDDWQGGIGFVDFTNPEACKWYQAQIEYCIDVGVTAFKTDFGERIPCEDVVYHSGSEPRAMHNHYSFLYNKTVMEVLERRLGAGQGCVFARSAAAGGQRFPVHWAGDSGK
jgi:alpha-D-xyloside xylohydrolase